MALGGEPFGTRSRGGGIVVEDPRRPVAGEAGSDRPGRIRALRFAEHAGVGGAAVVGESGEGQARAVADEPTPSPWAVRGVTSGFGEIASPQESGCGGPPESDFRTLRIDAFGHVLPGLGRVVRHTGQGDALPTGRPAAVAARLGARGAIHLRGIEATRFDVRRRRDIAVWPASRGLLGLCFCYAAVGPAWRSRRPSTPSISSSLTRIAASTNRWRYEWPAIRRRRRRT